MLMKYKDFKMMSINEMKNVLGGIQPGGGLCSIETACSLTIIGSNGQFTTFNGECGLNNGQCICVTDYGDYTPTSNGGVTRCDV